MANSGVMLWCRLLRRQFFLVVSLSQSVLSSGLAPIFVFVVFFSFFLFAPLIVPPVHDGQEADH